MDCMIIGDSIAVGIAQHRQCETRATVGISSDLFNRRYPQPIRSNRVLISLGSNDGPRWETDSALRLLRTRITANSVTWLLSSNNEISRSIVVSIAHEYGDRLLDVRPLVSSDRIHPTANGYRQLSILW